jgi:hypothetical protein
MKLWETPRAHFIVFQSQKEEKEFWEWFKENYEPFRGEPDKALLARCLNDFRGSKKRQTPATKR